MAYDGGFGDSKNASVDASDSGKNGGDRGSDSRNKNVRGGNPFADTRASTAPAPASDRGNGGSNPNRSLGSLRAELDRRDRAAVAALGGPFGGVNQASLAFNDDEEGINSIDEALGRFGAWAQDQVGINNPRGFLGSNLASLGAGALGFLAAGPIGASIGATATRVAADPQPSRNMIGYAANALGGLPGLGGLFASGVGLVDDNLVDLDRLTVAETMGSVPGQAQSLSAPAGTTATLGNQYAGRQGGNGAVPATSLASARTGNPATPAATTPKPNPNTIRRTFGPLNLRYAQLRGIEDLIYKRVRRLEWTRQS